MRPLTSFQRARRELLKRLGIGAAWLPLLRAGRARGETKPHKKLICVLGIHGYRQLKWKPVEVGPLGPQTLPECSSPLTPHKADIAFTTGLVHATPFGDGDYGTIFWGLPDVRGGGRYKEPAGKTLDQLVADAQPNLLPALNLAVQITLPPRAGNATEPGAWVCSWRGPGMPIEPRVDPLATYNQLFGNLVADPQPVQQLLVQRKSMLDYVGDSLQRYGQRVGTEERARVQAHLEAVRRLEQGLTVPVTPGKCGAVPPALDITDHALYPKIYAAHIDLMMAALTCGVANVVTLQLADASGTSVNFGAFVPGVPEKGTGFKTAYRNWHDLAHNPILGGIDHKAIVDQWWMAELAALITRLRGTLDLGGSSMLENTIVLWANTMEDGSNHNSKALPWVLAGRGGGALRTGMNAASAGQPSATVLAAVAKAMDVPGTPFGPPLAELLT